LLGLQEAQVQLLRSIDVKIDALLEGPYRTGRRQLGDALAEFRDADDRVHLLREARSSFTSALGQDPEPSRRSFAALHLAAVWIALRSPGDVIASLKEAHIEALRAVYVAAQPQRTLRGLLSLEHMDLSSSRSRRYDRSGPLVRYSNALAATRFAWECPDVSSSDPPPFPGGQRTMHDIPILGPWQIWHGLVEDPTLALPQMGYIRHDLRVLENDDMVLWWLGNRGFQLP
jgi:hypothetical protein